jgi:hypothetical protein
MLGFFIAKKSPIHKGVGLKKDVPWEIHPEGNWYNNNHMIVILKHKTDCFDKNDLF